MTAAASTNHAPKHAAPPAAADDLAPLTLAQLPAGMQAAVARVGWSALMPVQARTIPYMLARRDVMVQSRTGSGKTGAFVLPILERLDVSKSDCQALVLVPTRELALQVAREAERLSGPDGPRCAAVYGGVGYGAQIEAFNRGAHLVVGTPGRILDHLRKATLTLDALAFLVFDEADRMLSMGFYPDMRRVKAFLPHRRILGSMYSATYPPHVMRLAHEFLHQPVFLNLSSDHVHVAETNHVFYPAATMGRDRALIRIIEVENPASAIIFCNTKDDVHYVTTVLQRFGYDADELSSDSSQTARERVLARLRKGGLRFLVATDVAARGIDIKDLSHVIQYSPSEDVELYIHRAGRTGRAGAAGEAIILADWMEKMRLDQIARTYSLSFEERALPSDADVEAAVGERVTAMLEERLRGLDRVQRERLQRFINLGRSLADTEDELPIIAMLLDEYYQRMLHAPLPQPQDEAAQPTSSTGEGSNTARRRGRRRRTPRS
jgi:ATP-dependent RNA helicase DeaD